MTEKQIEIAETLFRNAEKISFGSVSVEIKVHAGKYANVIYTLTENTRQTEKVNSLNPPI